jgi:hypothetical protein
MSDLEVSSDLDGSSTLCRPVKPVISPAALAAKVAFAGSVEEI